jgi:hypothetical protein
LAEEYQVHVQLSAGPFAIDDSKPTIIRKSELQPKKKDSKKK